jgi:hypothetical protein
MWEERLGELSALASRQSGLFTTAQAGRSEIATETIEHFKHAGLIAELDWDVYQLAGSQLAPRFAYPFAAWLGLRPDRFQWERLEEGMPDAVLSHESACNLHGMGSLSAPHEVFTMAAERDAPRGTRIHVGRLTADDVTSCAGIPVTTPRRTIVDLVDDWAEHADVADVLADAVRRDLVDLRTVHDDLVPLAAEHEFPADGREFVAYFAPGLSLSALSARNKRAYAILTLPEKVAALRRRVRRLLEEDGAAADEQLSEDVAAEIAARTAQQ